MSARRLVSIGMPVYNCESTIAESIASILNQTFEEWELIVFDDGSKDGTLYVARQFSDPRIRVVEGGCNRGLPACLNRIISQSDTELFARMDGDDIAYPQRFEKQLKALEQNPQVDLLGGSTLIFNRTGVAHGFRHSAVTHKAICGMPWRIANLVHVTWIGRTEWFQRHPYNEWSTHSQDRDLIIRVRNDATFASLPDVLVGVREDAPVWAKLIRARRQLIRTALTEGIRQFDPVLLFVMTAAEVAKCGLDLIATSTGLGHRLLKYRVPPVSPERVAEWQDVLSMTRARVLREIGQQQSVRV